jgi:hypothetical protein
MRCLPICLRLLMKTLFRSRIPASNGREAPAGTCLMVTAFHSASSGCVVPLADSSEQRPGSPGGHLPHGHCVPFGFQWMRCSARGFQRVTTGKPRRALASWSLRSIRLPVDALFRSRIPASNGREAPAGTCLMVTAFHSASSGCVVPLADSSEQRERVWLSGRQSRLGCSGLPLPAGGNDSLFILYLLYPVHHLISLCLSTL